jgi:hypothetical protein
MNSVLHNITGTDGVKGKVNLNRWKRKVPIVSFLNYIEEKIMGGRWERRRRRKLGKASRSQFFNGRVGLLVGEESH